MIQIEVMPDDKQTERFNTYYPDYMLGSLIQQRNAKGELVNVIPRFKKRVVDTSKYVPHQGKQEMERRRNKL